MAKAANQTKPATDTASGDYEFVDDLPAQSKRGGAAQPSEDVAKLENMPEPREVNGKTQYARVWYPVGTAPAELTEAAAREQWTKDTARKMTNRLSGITRRITKKDASKAYTVRTVENNGQPGVAVYRMAKATAPAA